MNPRTQHADVSLDDDPLFNPRYEEQFVLRLPLHVAEKMSDRAVVESIRFHWEDNRTGTCTIDGEELPMRLVDLPCILETHKTVDKVQHFKTGDVGQAIIVGMQQKKEGRFIKGDRMISGITPPTKEITTRVWHERKIESLKEAEAETIRLTKGGIANDVELTVVEPHEVEHIPDFSEQTFRPGTPTGLDSPTADSPSPMIE